MRHGNKEKYVCTTCGREGYFYKEPKNTNCQKIGCPGKIFKVKERS